MEIIGTKCTLRPFRHGDEERLAQLADNRKIWRNMADNFAHPYTLEAARAWIGEHSDVPEPRTHFAITSDDALIGGTGFTVQADIHRTTVRAGYWVGEPYWGRGIATAAFTMLTRYIFANFEDIMRIEATVFSWNPGSCRVLEKCGFTHELLLRKYAIKDGTVADMHLYALLR